MGIVRKKCDREREQEETASDCPASKPVSAGSSGIPCSRSKGIASLCIILERLDHLHLDSISLPFDISCFPFHDSFLASHAGLASPAFSRFTLEYDYIYDPPQKSSQCSCSFSNTHSRDTFGSFFFFWHYPHSYVLITHSLRIHILSDPKNLPRLA